MTFCRSILAFAVAVATACCSASPARNATPVVHADTIFRHVSIGPNVPIVLGSPLPQAAQPHVQQVASNIVAVRPGHFSGAAGIAVHLAPDGRVAAVIFTYAPGDEGFEAKVASYGETLGPPIRSGQAGERAAYWQDARTRFEVAERTGGLVGVLSDLGLRRRTNAAE